MSINLEKLFEAKLQEHLLKIYKPHIKNWINDFWLWKESNPRGDGLPDNDAVWASELCRFGLFKAAALRENLKKISFEYENFTIRYGRADDQKEKQAHILDFSRGLGATKRELKKDKKAFRRMFGPDAITERYFDIVSETEYEVFLLLERCRTFAVLTFEHKDDQDDALLKQLWRQMDLENKLDLFIGWKGDRRIVQNALKCLFSANAQAGNRQISDELTTRIYQAAQNVHEDVWVQNEALRLLFRMDKSVFFKLAQMRFKVTSQRDDIFVRRFILSLIKQGRASDVDVLQLFDIALKDKSPHVRQSIPEGLVSFGWQDKIEQIIGHLLFKDPEACVRAEMVLNIPDFVTDHEKAQNCLPLLIRVFETEKDPFVLRCGLKALEDGYEKFLQYYGQHAHLEIMNCLERIQSEVATTSIRRQAQLCRERLWLSGEADLCHYAQKLQDQLKSVKHGRGIVLSSSDLIKYDFAKICRMLSVLAQNDFGLELCKSWRGGYKLIRGSRFSFRLWRFLHELKLSASDKRQGFSHLIGRYFHGRWIFPSAIMGELSPTKVPGEPFYVSEDGSWRPFTPLVDHLISAIDNGGETQIYTAQGVTTMRAPKRFLTRLVTRFRLSYRFNELASLRNWHKDDTIGPETYLQTVGNMGLKVSHAPYSSSEKRDKSVQHFFPAIIPAPLMPIWERFQTYFLSVYENTIFHLLLFISAVGVLFLGRHFWMYRQIRKARKDIALSIGGWGTRGKSGTERLKAALMNGLGHGVTSKTTGCEAMFVFARPFRNLTEMFLFRPYDKATIWEQHFVVRLATRLKSSVFLWECMALTPSYVKILSRQWMKDDIATITNTYPDHEDIQGPAGWNIPEVMVDFIPPNAQLFTTEEEMYPILREGAQAQSTSIHPVGWLEAGLIAPDILARFPYDEHPYNIALVEKMARSMGMDRDYALKEMADRVVPDLGVLKTYPLCDVNARQLQFVNGMSANERFGCLGNWGRLGFIKEDPWQKERNWVCTVVNNRADREPRSKVFAAIIAEDISADRHVLIGSNLNGLYSYIEEAWQARMEEVSLKEFEGRSATEIATGWFHQLRICLEPEHIEAFKEAMNYNPEDENDPYLEDKKRFYTIEKEKMEKAQGILSKIEGASAEHLEEPFKALLTEFFMEKITVVQDYYASGNDVCSIIANALPPHLKCRVMGMQNIKGTGLDFVYSWQAWDRVYKALEHLNSSIAEISWMGLQDLAAMTTYPLQAFNVLEKTLKEVRSMSFAQSETYQTLLNRIESNLESSKSNFSHDEKNDSDGSFGPLKKIITGLEHFLDAGDAVKRRKATYQIYDDLVHQRIGLERAVSELQALNKRQKGGWLLESLGLK